MSTLATNIRRLMAQQDLTYTEVVQTSGLDARTLRGLVRGTNTPHARTLHKLAAGLGVAVDELFRPIGSWCDSSGQVDVGQANAALANVRLVDTNQVDANQGDVRQAGLGLGLADLGLADQVAGGYAGLGPEEEFDRDTNSAIPAAVTAHPDVFAGWTRQQFAELSSRFGVGGALNEQGALAAARAMNAKQEVVDRVAVILETSQAQLLSDFVELLYDHLTSANETTANEAIGYSNPSPPDRPR